MSEHIIVVGAGIVGLTSVLDLAQQGYCVTLIEANPYPKQTPPQPDEAFDVRVVAINRASQQIFQQLEVWRTIQQSRVCAYQTMHVWDHLSDGMITFSAMDYFEPDLGHIIEQQVIIGALWQAIKISPQINILCGEKVLDIHQGPDTVKIKLQSGATLEAPLLIAADGAKSGIRSLCNIEIKSRSYDQSAIVATIKGAIPHRATAFQRFASDGPLALLPLSAPDYFSIVWTTSPEQAQQLCAKPLCEFDSLLTQQSAGILGQLSTQSQRHIFPLACQQARQYVKGRCVLVGDAAHTIHPLAGQGVNLGLKDVACLMDLLRQNKAMSREIGYAPSLKTYQRHRQLHNHGMSIAMECFKRGFGSANTLVRTLRNVGLNVVDRQKWLKHMFVKSAQGIP